MVIVVIVGIGGQKLQENTGMGMMVIMVLMGIATVYKGVNAEARGEI